MPENNMKGGIADLAHGFKDVSSPWQGGYDRAEPFTSWWIDIKEKGI
jgi:hypothetical protein